MYFIFKGLAFSIVLNLSQSVLSYLYDHGDIEQFSSDLMVLLRTKDRLSSWRGTVSVGALADFFFGFSERIVFEVAAVSTSTITIRIVQTEAAWGKKKKKTNVSDAQCEKKKKNEDAKTNEITKKNIKQSKYMPNEYIVNHTKLSDTLLLLESFIFNAINSRGKLKHVYTENN